jgi:hypothetical protein
MAGKAAAIITASKAEMKAVKVKVQNATQKRPDFPDQMFFLCGVVGGGVNDFSSSTGGDDGLGGLGKSMEDMLISGVWSSKDSFLLIKS